MLEDVGARRPEAIVVRRQRLQVVEAGEERTFFEATVPWPAVCADLVKDVAARDLGDLRSAVYVVLDRVIVELRHPPLRLDESVATGDTNPLVRRPIRLIKAGCKNGPNRS